MYDDLKMLGKGAPLKRSGLILGIMESSLEGAEISGAAFDHELNVCMVQSYKACSDPVHMHKTRRQRRHAEGGERRKGERSTSTSSS